MNLMKMYFGHPKWPGGHLEKKWQEMQTKINFKHFKQPAAILKKKSCVLI
jgi:hypothetical protein